MRRRHAHPAHRRPVPTLVLIACVLSVVAWLDVRPPEPGLTASGVAVDPSPTRPPTRSTSRPAAPSSGSSASDEITGVAAAIADASPPTARHTTGPTPPVEAPACRLADKTTEPGAGGDWALAVLDTAFRLPPGYAPRDLVPVSQARIPGGGLVRRLILADLSRLASAARAAGVPLTVHSAFRSEASQAAVYHQWVRGSGVAAARRSSARPGHSEHQLGTTLDLGAGSAAPWTTNIAAVRVGRWLAAHVVGFGFVVSYPKGASSATCYDAEPWHIRWVGRGRAAAVKASGLTLREWLWAHRRD